MMAAALERSKRAILIGNIPSDTSEEQFITLLREFGSIIDFRFFNDSSGNQIGYAFCEYGNQDMAVRAIRQLNDFEYRGQILKAETAASDKSKEELESFLQGGGGSNARIVPENQEQPDLDSRGEKAPEEISKAVASLPPEQMFELMKQMKMCIENNPHEARNLLLQNPQLAYALLQAQVIMRIVDPEVAIKILDRPVTVSPDESAIPTSEASTSSESVPTVPGIESNPSLFPPGFPVGNDQDMRQFRDSDMRNLNNTEIGRHLFDPRYRSGPEPGVLQGPNVRMQDPRMMPESDSRGMPNFDPRAVPSIDPRVSSNSDPRRMPVPDPRGMLVTDPRGMPVTDPRGMPVADPRGMPVSDPRGMPVSDPRGMPVSDPRGMPVTGPRVAPFSDPRGIPGTDPRGVMGPDPRTLPNIDQRMDPRSTNPSDPRASRAQDPRMNQLPDARLMPMGSTDPRMAPGIDPRMFAGLNKASTEVKTSNMDPRAMPATDPRVSSGGDPRLLSGDPRIAPMTDPRARPGSDPRLKPFEDSLKPPTSDGASAPASHLLASVRAPIPPKSSGLSSIGVPPARPTDILSSLTSGSQRPDQEKAALIMQVLQLSDEQIAILPPEQRQSILLLKEQVARSHLT